MAWRWRPAFYGRPCYKGRLALLQRAAGLATMAQRRCYKELPALLPWHGGVATGLATMVWRRCSQRPPVLLRRHIGATTMDHQRCSKCLPRCCCIGAAASSSPATAVADRGATSACTDGGDRAVMRAATSTTPGQVPSAASFSGDDGRGLRRSDDADVHMVGRERESSTDAMCSRRAQGSEDSGE